MEGEQRGNIPTRKRAIQNEPPEERNDIKCQKH